MNPNNPSIRGTAQNEDIYFQVSEVRNKYYDAIPDIVNDYMDKINASDKIILLSKLDITDAESYKFVRETIKNQQKDIIYERCARGCF